MAYQTGTYNTREQLLDALRVFAEANGWTTDAFVDFRGGKWLAHHNADGIYLHWYSANNVLVNIYDRDTSGSYGGTLFTGLVLHPATGYDSNKHPGWQPGVLGSDNRYTSYGSGSTRQIFNSGTLTESGIYHFISGANMLALFVDTSEQAMRHLCLFKTTPFSGQQVTYALTGSLGAANDTSYPGFFAGNNNTGNSSFGTSDRTAMFAGGAWNRLFRNENDAWVSTRLSSYYTSESGKIDHGVLITHSGISGVTGVRPLHPVIFQKRVSNVFRFDSMLPHVAHVNGFGLAKAQAIQTASGAWRVFQYGSDANTQSIAIRSDL